MPEKHGNPVRKALFTDEFVQDPYPTYRRLLEEGPLHFVDVGGGMWGIWAVFSHADCSAVAKDPRLSAKRTDRMLVTLPFDRQDEFKQLVRMLGMWMIFIDPPEHTRMRKLMNKGFSPSATEALRPQVEKVVDKILESLAHMPQADLVNELAYPMPVRVISELLGVPETRAHSFNGPLPSRSSMEARAAQSSTLKMRRMQCLRLPISSEELSPSGAATRATT